MNKKITITLIVVLLVVLGFILLNPNQDNQTKDKELTSNNSFELLTYTNDEYGISFKYPENWRIVDGEDQVSEPYIALVVKGDTSPRSRMLVSIGTQNKIKNQEDLYESEIEVKRNYLVKNLTINENPSTLIKNQKGSGSGYIKMFIFGDNNTYTITLTNENDYFDDFKKVFETIYKSFETL